MIAIQCASIHYSEMGISIVDMIAESEEMGGDCGGIVKWWYNVNG